MKISYYVTIDPDEDKPLCIFHELEPEHQAVLIHARTKEEAVQMLKGAFVQ